MTEDDLDNWRCADCQRPLIDCPGEAKTLPDGSVVCEPCVVRRAIADVVQTRARRGMGRGRT